MKFFQKLLKWVPGDKDSRSAGYNFRPLIPDDSVGLDIYEDSLNVVFTNDKVLNVALSGPYGAGKSSVVASYAKKHAEKKFIHISLAHFEPSDTTDDPSSVEKETKKSGENFLSTVDTVLEGKILNQLLHQIAPGKIPRTRFRVRETPGWKRIVIFATSIFCLICGLCTWFFTQWTGFVQAFAPDFLKRVLSFYGRSEARFWLGLLFCITVVILSYFLVRHQSLRPFVRKAGVKGIEIEIFEDSKESYFDKYLSEVLYLFDKADADVIVFEDIDRFDSSKIFERLHEINRLVNIRRRRNRALRFFYLLRDDIFESKNRTKFFDFIMPIVPVVDGSNSYDVFIKCFEKSGLRVKGYTLFDTDFLQGLSLYIDEMRVLQNICNEFIVYHVRLSTTGQDPDKMLALVAYKNLFPRDFSDLQLGRGLLYEIIGGRGKDKLLASERQRLNSVIKEKEAELSGVENEALFSDEIVRSFYLELFFKVNEERNTTVSISSNQEGWKKFTEGYRRNVVFKPKFDAYDKRLLSAEDSNEKRDKRIAGIQSEIASAKRKLAELEGLRLKDLINRDNSKELFTEALYTSETGREVSFSSLKDSPYFAMVKFLVREGYIDETYSDYMTYFYENSLTRADKIFLRSVTDREAKEHSYLLTNAKLVAERIPLAYLGQVEALNFSLFSFLLGDMTTDTPRFAEKGRRLIQQVKEGKLFGFVLEYCALLDEDKLQMSFGNLVLGFGAEWPSFIGDYFSANGLGDKPSFPKSEHDGFIFKYAYTFLNLVGVDSKNLKILDGSSRKRLAAYISNDSDFLCVEECNDQNVALGIRQLGVSFARINGETANYQLLERVYTDNLYDINLDNIKTMLSAFYADLDEDISVLTANYTAVMTNVQSPLAEYVNDNIEAYITEYLSKCGNEITDAPDRSVSLLNNDWIGEGNKRNYISYMRTAIPMIESVKDESLWSDLLDNGTAIEYTAANVVSYFSTQCEGAFDDVLINYINGKGTFVSLGEYLSDEKTTDILFDALVISTKLDSAIYKGFLEQKDLCYNEFSVKGLPEDKLAILDKLNIIQMSKGSLEFIRENYDGYMLIFIVNRMADYLKVLTENEGVVDHAEIVALLDKEISDVDKVSLVKLCNETISIRDKKQYSDALKAFILRDNYDDKDFDYLLTSYTQQGEQTQAMIRGIAINEIEDVMPRLDRTDRTLLSALLESDGVDVENKREIFKKLATYFSDEDVKRLLPSIGSAEFLEVFRERGNRKYDNNAWSSYILDLFVERRFIGSYKLDDEDNKYTITRPRKDGRPRDKGK